MITTAQYLVEEFAYRFNSQSLNGLLIICMRIEARAHPFVDDTNPVTISLGIYINLLKMFEESWYKEFRSDKKYSLKWIEQFLNDLMRSEWRDKIANDWYKPDKKKTVLGYIIGCLISAGVLEGSDSAIATAVVKHINFDNKAIVGKTIAINFGKGRKKGYCEWICDYVKH